MPLNPPPTIQGNLLLVTQKLIRSDMSRAAEVGYCLSTADSLLATYQDAIDDFQANFNTNITPNIDAEVTVLPPTGVGGVGTTDTILVTAAGAAVNGAGTAVDLPPNCALLVRKNTSAGGRQNRGRTYLPFFLISANVSENGTIGTSYLAGLQTTLTAFLAQLATDSTPMAIENRAFNTPLPPHFVTLITKSANPVTSYVAESMIATQRRRLGR